MVIIAFEGMEVQRSRVGREMEVRYCAMGTVWAFMLAVTVMCKSKRVLPLYLDLLLSVIIVGRRGYGLNRESRERFRGYVTGESCQHSPIIFGLSSLLVRSLCSAYRCFQQTYHTALIL